MKEQKINYPWSKAPHWAQWAATDSDGNFFWYEQEPFLAIREWLIDDGKHKYGFRVFFEDCSEWKQSLQKRPTINEINYPWDWAPKWANYAVILSNGDAYWLEQEPTLTYSNWSVTEGRALPIGECSNPKHVENYELSLQKRPAK